MLYLLRPDGNGKGKAGETLALPLPGFDHVFAALLEFFLFPLVPLLDGTEEPAHPRVNLGFFCTFGRHPKLSFVRGEA